MQKLGRNQLCWCQSGKKYKKCHWERDKQPRMQPWEVAAGLRRQAENARYCAHALASATTCQGPIVRAHSIPRSAGLAAIAENGHVFGPDYDYMSIVKSKGELDYHRIGINEASTFTGFCQFHDTTTFTALENQPLVPTAEQCFLMGYRAVCREQFLKRLHMQSVQIMRDADRGKALDRQEEIQWKADMANIGTMLGFADITHEKKYCDSVLTTRSWNDYHSLRIEFGKPVEILCTGAFGPEFDFMGRVVQDPMDIPAALVTMTILPSNRGAIAVMGWTDQSDAVCKPFAHSLSILPEEEVGNALVRLIFDYVGNTYTRPSWWEALSSGMRNALRQRIRVGADPEMPHLPDGLKNDGHRYVDWPIVNMKMS